MRFKRDPADRYDAATFFTADEITEITEAGRRLAANPNDVTAVARLLSYRVPPHYVSIFGESHNAEQTGRWALRLATTAARRDTRV